MSGRPPQARYCRQFCAELHNGRRIKTDPFPERVCGLAECEIVIPAGFAVKKYCSEVHGKRAWVRAQHAAGRSFYDGWSEARKANDQARRARKVGATTGEKFTSLQIFDRDEWTCYLCSKSVDAALAHPDPLSASLDHVVPLVRGGEHSAANCRLAHLTCNIHKGDKDADASLLAEPPPLVKHVRPRRRIVLPMSTLVIPERRPLISRTSGPDLSRILIEALELKASLEGAMPSR